MNEEQFKTFDDFWPFYVRQHAHKTTRTLHLVGSTIAMACLAGGLLFRKRSLLPLVPVAAYGPAWAAHFFIEKNRPATFKYPLWSLRADFIMCMKMLGGTMDAEVEQAMASDGDRREHANGSSVTHAAAEPYREQASLN
ncbi:DUF962 domain-containing protein [Sorangium sp. So ce136]|uniref:Mpo1-like protein n=1 Tax=Sorangium sp. So ce136 TaxID=3133284 RepID=UPI003F0EBB20